MYLDWYRFYYGFQGDRRLPTILFLHGFLGDSEEFTRSIDLLCDRFCCLTIDLPGHGQTKVLGESRYYSMGETALAAIELLDKLDIQKCFLVGYSMGGRFALYLSIYFPERFTKVVLESASPGLKTSQERAKRINSDLKLAEELLNTELIVFLNKWYANRLFGSLNQHADFADLLERRLKNNPLELAKSLRYFGTGAQPSLWQYLPTHRSRSLLLVGERDRKFIQINQEMSQLLKFCQLEIVNDCGHNIHIENSNLFTNLISQFLENG
jgi:2-succinyl-6-hydroxy-2,4-cyclohexadiene-1-carboxylate synthase